MSSNLATMNESAKPLAAYSAGRIITLSPNLALFYISGTTARQADGQIPPFGHSSDLIINSKGGKEPKPAAIQTKIILDKISSVISNASGGSGGLESLVELTIFVKDLKNDYGVVNKVYNEIVGQKFAELGIPLPARTCVQVNAMPPDERTLVEMKGVARIET